MEISKSEICNFAKRYADEKVTKYAVEMQKEALNGFFLMEMIMTIKYQIGVNLTHNES